MAVNVRKDGSVLLYNNKLYERNCDKVHVVKRIQNRRQRWASPWARID